MCYEVKVEIERSGRRARASYCAFIGAMPPSSFRNIASLWKVAFSTLDLGKDDSIDCADLSAVFGRDKDREACKSIFAEVARALLAELPQSDGRRLVVLRDCCEEPNGSASLDCSSYRSAAART